MIMKVKDGIMGLVIGDALGVPVEFTQRYERESDPVTCMRCCGTYNMPAGTWSDDSSMTIATMASIINVRGIDYEAIMGEFCEWLFNEKYVQYRVFDYGNTTGSALYKSRGGTPALECGGIGDRDNGNGSLMRILPLAFIPDIDYETIENVSALTHAHKRSKIACVFYIEIAKSMLESEGLTIDEHIKTATDKIIEYYKGDEELNHFKRIFNDDLDDIDTINSGGYVIDTFESVVYCLKNTDNYRDAVLKAVNLGKDTDTVGAICGGLAGIYYGYDDIPEEWIWTIYKKNYILLLCEEFEDFCEGLY